MIAAWICTVVAVAAWLALLGWFMATTRTPTVPDLPQTPEHRADSPAVVDMVTGGWKVCDEAAAATVIDLAARGFVRIEAIGPALSLVRLRPGADSSGLAAYERLALDHIRKLATADGVVATGALAEGARSRLGWWRAFAQAVRDETRAAGLSEPRWAARTRTILLVAAALPSVAAGIAAAVSFKSTDDEILFGPFIGGVVIMYCAASALVERVNTERGTLAGAHVAAQWTAFRDHLSFGRFADQPAAAVTIWGRQLAYAAALGLADVAVASLPISRAADDNKAWSDFGGMWHEVHVHYRGRGIRRLWWGRRPWELIGRAALTALMFGGPIFILSAAAAAFGKLDVDPVRVSLLVVGSVLAVAAGAAIVDIFTRATIIGQVVRSRQFVQQRSNNRTTYRYWIGIDDGRSREIHAYGIDSEGWSTISEGDVVEVRVGKTLGWIYDVRVTQPSRFHAEGPQ